MAADIIPADLREFILRHVDSVAHLEALLLLRRNPDAEWDAAGAAARLYVSQQQTAEVLARLSADGFVTGSGPYRYGCRSVELAQLVDRLAETYARHLVPITNLIHDKPRRIREFADAFKLRKEP